MNIFEEVMVQGCGLLLAGSDTAALMHGFVHHGIHDLEQSRFIDEVTLLLNAYLSATGLARPISAA